LLGQGPSSLAGFEIGGEVVPMRILIAEDSLTQAVDLRRRLEALGHEVVVTATGVEAWSHLQTKAERLVISDWMMPEMNGLELCRKIRAEITSRYVYVILLTAKTHRHERIQGLNAGADDFLAKPIDSAELEVALKTAQRIIAAQNALDLRARELERTNQELIDLASRDELTGLKNHRGFLDVLDVSARQADADRLPLSLVRLELDHPERILAALEPGGWERTLVEVARLLESEVRACDTVARVSGHGFAIILPSVTEEGALAISEILRDSIAALPTATPTLSASVGVSTRFADGQPASTSLLHEAAGRALAQAQAQGGNRVIHLLPCGSRQEKAHSF
jgi:two-component system cell cycle response regulator